MADESCTVGMSSLAREITSKSIKQGVASVWCCAAPPVQSTVCLCYFVHVAVTRHRGRSPLVSMLLDGDLSAASATSWLLCAVRSSQIHCGFRKDPCRRLVCLVSLLSHYAFAPTL